MVEYLVTMTTTVPEGTPPQEVDDVRSREAAHTRELADQGRVLRLWRPPLGPGEWRTIGLFAAEGLDDLARTLASMPLSVWRTDAPIELSPHPNDPGRDRVPVQAGAEESLVTLILQVPADTHRRQVDELLSDESARARQLATTGHLLRLWMLPVPGHSLGLWQATGAQELDEILTSLPLALAGWLTTETTLLTRHPSDPGPVILTT